MDPLTEHHVHNSVYEKHVSREDLVVGLVQHGLRNIPHHEHVLKDITHRQQYTGDFIPQPYRNTEKVQQIHW